MDNNKSYIERRKRYSRNKLRHRSQDKVNSPLLLLRVNICLGVLVLIVISSYIDYAPANVLCEGVENLVEKNMQSEDIKKLVGSIWEYVAEGDISVMAKNNNADFYLDPEIIDQIEAKKNIQKKTQ